jgi:hypothetical protein
MVVKIHTAVFWVMTTGRSVTTFLGEDNAPNFRAENGDSMFL